MNIYLKNITKVDQTNLIWKSLEYFAKILMTYFKIMK